MSKVLRRRGQLMEQAGGEWRKGRRPVTNDTWRASGLLMLIPDGYRAFLLQHNGGLPLPSDFSLGPGRGASTLHHTYDLHDGPEYFRLDDTYEVYRGRLPASLLAIADDPGGNAICIGLRGEERAKIYFWDHEGESDPPIRDNEVELAPSFTAFCDALFDFDAAAGYRVVGAGGRSVEAATPQW